MPDGRGDSAACNMRNRLISAGVCIAVLFLIVFLAPVWGVLAALEILTAISMYEFLASTKFVRNRALMIASGTFALLVLPWVYVGRPGNLVPPALYAYTAALFAMAMGSRGEVTLEMLGGAFFASIFIPTGFSALLDFRMEEAGKFMVLLPFVASVLTDTAAFFIGRKYGRMKLAPGISPHKTWEGAIAGLIGGLAGVLLYGLILKLALKVEYSWSLLVLTGILGSCAAQFGDLCFSYIKRRFGIKDYGSLIPGHGGILDRLDSILFAAPVMAFVLAIIG